MLVGAIQGLLDRQHVLIFRCRFNERNYRVVRIERMVQQNVVPPQFLKQVLGFRREPQFPRGERTIFQIRPGRLLVNIEQPRKVYRTVHRKNLPGIKLKHGSEPLNDLRIGIRLNFHTHRIALAAIVQFRTHRFQKIARLFFLQIKIAVPGYPEGRRGNNVVSVIHMRRVMRHQVREENEVRRILRRKSYQTR